MSQPKSGTYLCQNLLAEMGFDVPMIHISAGHYHRYDPENLLEGRTNPKKYKHQGKPKLEDNSVAVTHLKDSALAQYADFKKIYLSRPDDQRKASAQRWKKYRKSISSALPNQPANSFHLQFSDMININVEKLNALQQYLFGTTQYDSAHIMQTALLKDSLTKSEIR